MGDFMIRLAFRASLAATIVFAAVLPARADAPLIPRDVLFGNPERTAPQLSPDGTKLAWLAPLDGVLNVYVAPRENMAAAKPVTHDHTRPIRDFFFSPDSSKMLYMQDKGGNENFLLYAVDLASGKETTLTPFQNTRVEIVGASPLHKQELILGLNNRDPHWHDLYKLHLDTGKLDFIRKGDGYAGFTVDFDLVPRLATRSNADGTYTVEALDRKGKSKKLFDIPFADGLTTSPAGIPKGANYMYLMDSRGHDKTQLETYDLTTGKITPVASDDKADIGGALSDPMTGKAHAYEVDYLKNRYVALDDTYRADIAFLDSQSKGQWAATSSTDDDKLWVVVIDPVDHPAAFWLYDRTRKNLTKIFTARPALEKYVLAPMQAFEIPARDGKILTAYLTLPAGTGDRPAKPLPMVLEVHGGPWARDSYGYNPHHQWLANRGYAVLSVNYRGSTGFGKAFVAAGDKQWGRAMQDDLLDASAWAVKNGITTADQIAIKGGSYGGYATLAALTMTPKAFACGVDIVGPSNLLTLLATIPPYWKSGYEQMVGRVGDPRTESGRALLKERSPLTYAAQIERPLLIGQGANDPRVHRAESDQIAAVMKAKHIPLTYVLYPDEGHGFARPENNLSFNAVTEKFLSSCLHGKMEPVGNDFKNSTLQFLADGQ
jgi:dipeptidyl aminopeptidase/acylaminoacyl peptidase